jgi:predicted O-methyltransferase YrrM
LELQPIEAALDELALLDTSPQAEEAVARAYRELQHRRANSGAALPQVYNPDRNLVRLIHAAVVGRKAGRVVEVGVGNGVCTSVILDGLSDGGRLVSIDLPPVSDPRGLRLGQAVGDGLRGRWVLRRGSSRRLLPGVLAELGDIDVFLSDGANLTNLQLLELQMVWPHLLPGSGIAVFNNVSREFVDKGRQVTGTRIVLIAQPDKPGAATACLAKP